MSTNKYKYTYDDVLDAMAGYGFKDGYMSQADLDLAKANPDAGMELVNYKNTWLTSSDPTEKENAHSGAEGVRQQHGMYSGGADGGSYAASLPTPAVTFDDYLKKAQEYGMTADQISEADMKLAQLHPDIGIQMLDNKNIWLTSDDESAKAFAHADNEYLRNQYGAYTGGEDGGSFAKIDKTAAEEPAAATPAEPAAATPAETAAEYDDPWETAIQATLRNMENRKFEWSPETDPMVEYYEDAYRREGERAMKDTLGALSGMTGGNASSYASAAAAQQRNYYAQQLTDKYQELYQQAYENFLKEYERDYQMFDAYQRMSDSAYTRAYNQQLLDLENRKVDVTENQNLAQNEIAWAELGLKDKEITSTLEMEYAKLDQNDRQFARDLMYRYDVLTEEGSQFWAQLAENGRIADAELQYKYDALSQEAQQFLKEYALAVRKQEADERYQDAQVEIMWEELGIKKTQITADIDLAYKQLDQNDRHFIEEMLYKYDVLGEESAQFWAELAQNKEISDANLKYNYDQLSQSGKEFMQKLKLEYATLEFEKEAHKDEVRLTEAEIAVKREQIKLQYAQLDEEKRQHIENVTLAYKELLQNASQWADQKAMNETEENIELAFAAAEMGDFSLLKELGVDTSTYELLWDMEIEGKLDPTDDEVMNDVIDEIEKQQSGAVTGGEVFNTAKETAPVVQMPLVTPNTLTNERREEANAGKSDTQIAAEKTQTAQEIKDQQKPDALYQRYIQGGKLTANEMAILTGEYDRAEIAKDKYLNGVAITAEERKLIEGKYGSNFFTKHETKR